MASAVALGVSAPAAALAADTPTASDTQTAEITVGDDVYGVLQPRTYDLTECPWHAPYLSTHEYHPGSGFGIPRGVEIRLFQDVVAITAGATYRAKDGVPRASGVLGVVVSNGLLPNRVAIILHCTSDPG